MKKTDCFGRQNKLFCLTKQSVFRCFSPYLMIIIRAYNHEICAIFEIYMDNFSHELLLCKIGSHTLSLQKMRSEIMQMAQIACLHTLYDIGMKAHRFYLNNVHKRLNNTERATITCFAGRK